jgi:hypothetical protein
MFRRFSAATVSAAAAAKLHQQQLQNPLERCKDLLAACKSIKEGRDNQGQVYPSFELKVRGIVERIQKYRLKQYEKVVWHEGMLFYVAYNYLVWENFLRHHVRVKDKTDKLKLVPKPDLPPSLSNFLPEMKFFLLAIEAGRECFGLRELLYSQWKKNNGVDFLDLKCIIRLLNAMVNFSFYQHVLKDDPIAWVLWAHVVATLNVLVNDLHNWSLTASSERYDTALTAKHLIDKINLASGSAKVSEPQSHESFIQILDDFIVTDMICIRHELAITTLPANHKISRQYFSYLLGSRRYSDPNTSTFIKKIVTKVKEQSAEFVEFVEAIEHNSQAFFEKICIALDISAAAATPPAAAVAEPVYMPPNEAIYIDLHDATTPLVAAKLLLVCLSIKYPSVKIKLTKLAEDPTRFSQLQRRIVEPAVYSEIKKLVSTLDSDATSKLQFFMGWNFTLLHCKEVVGGSFASIIRTSKLDYQINFDLFVEIIVHFTTSPEIRAEFAAASQPPAHRPPPVPLVVQPIHGTAGAAAAAPPLYDELLPEVAAAGVKEDVYEEDMLYGDINNEDHSASAFSAKSGMPSSSFLAMASSAPGPLNPDQPYTLVTKGQQGPPRRTVTGKAEQPIYDQPRGVSPYDQPRGVSPPPIYGNDQGATGSGYVNVPVAPRTSPPPLSQTVYGNPSRTPTRPLAASAAEYQNAPPIPFVAPTAHPAARVPRRLPIPRPRTGTGAIRPPGS